VLGYIILRVAVGFIGWAVINAIWDRAIQPQGVPDTSSCQNLKGIGACWAIIPG